MSQPPPPSVPSPDALHELYARRREQSAAAGDALDGRLHRLGLARLGLFGLAAACLVWALVAGVPAGVAVAALLLAGFVALVILHERVARERRRYALLWQLNREAGWRLDRDWTALPLEQGGAPAPDHPYALDLDIFGAASLQQLLGTVSTEQGQATLRAWLLAPAPPATVRERQAAVRELAPHLDLRDELTLRGRLLQRRRHDLEPFLEWAESAPLLPGRTGLVWASRLLPLGACGLLLAQVVGLVGAPWWLLFVAANLALDQWQGKDIDAVLARVTEQAGALEHYAALFGLLAGERWQAPALQRLHATLADDAQRETAALGSAVRLSYLRLNMFYFFVEMLTLSNWHFLWRLERWQVRAGGRVRGWLAALGEAEALAALAALAHDNPSWAFPELVEDAAPLLVGEALGHPLLPPARCVTNDVTIGPPGSVLLITGSNMSGKSTLLRAVGVNAVLAQAGGPVCAAGLRLPPLTLHTSMRVQDSLAHGVSYFMAELRDLKRVVDDAVAARAHGGTLLYLLDEILQGTNTAERQIAARQIIAHLVAQGAIGAVSTHDLALAESAELAAVCQPVHFTEDFRRGPAGPEMSFDYHLRPGLATSTNALKLMELIGLQVDAEPTSA